MKKITSLLFVLPLAWTLGGCVTDYTKSEAPNNLRVDGAETRLDIAFISGSARLAQPDAIQQLVAAGRIQPADRVAISAAGSPSLAEQRAAVISRELLAYGIVGEPSSLEAVPANHAVLGIGRYTVTLPPCPNWSSPPGAEYTNASRSNWGCADAVNLGLMVASPADLVSGRSLTPADGMPAVAAVSRYLNDRVKPPPSQTATPFAAPTGGGDTGAGGGASGAGAGAQ
ncbi:MAG: CpaD family pilus assembly lipoprotein [Stellaceae bacterium]